MLTKLADNIVTVYWNTRSDKYFHIVSLPWQQGNLKKALFLHSFSDF